MGNEGAIQSYFNAAHVHLQASFCHSSLISQIRIERIGDFLHFPGNVVANEQGLYDLHDFTMKNIGQADLIVYLAHDEFYPGLAAGMAPTNTACVPSNSYMTMNLPSCCGKVTTKTNAWKFSINEYQSSKASFGTVSYINVPVSVRSI